jgi:hypothetical protein
LAKLSSAGKRVEPDWTPILLRKKFQNQRVLQNSKNWFGD